MAVFPLFLPLAITAFGGPEGQFSLAIIAFGAFEFLVPKYYCRLGKMELKSLDSLFKEVTVFKVSIAIHLGKLLRLGAPTKSSSGDPTLPFESKLLPAVLFRKQTKGAKDQKGTYKRGIHDQGDFWKFLLEIAV